MNNDIISRNALIQHGYSAIVDGVEKDIIDLSDVDNAPTVEYPFYQEAYQTGYEEGKNEMTQDLIDKVNVNVGLAQPIKDERPQGNIRWTDKLSVTSNGDIIDFEGRVLGHINLEDMIGGAE